MAADGRTFVVASDKALIELIAGARDRLVVIAPALTEAVAEALSRRLRDLNDRVTIILDSDPEVYRLGFGDPPALEMIREVSAVSHVGLREQRGVRIGVVIADYRTMVYSPVSMNIEAGSTSVDKPNAIILSGSIADRLATAAGSDSGVEVIHSLWERLVIFGQKLVRACQLTPVERFSGHTAEWFVAVMAV